MVRLHVAATARSAIRIRQITDRSRASRVRSRVSLALAAGALGTRWGLLEGKALGKRGERGVINLDDDLRRWSRRGGVARATRERRDGRAGRSGWGGRGAAEVAGRLATLDRAAAAVAVRRRIAERIGLRIGVRGGGGGVFGASLGEMGALVAAEVCECDDGPGAQDAGESLRIAEAGDGESAHLDLLEQVLGITVFSRGNQLTLSGPSEPVASAQLALDALYRRLEKGRAIARADIEAAIRMTPGHSMIPIEEGLTDFNDDTLTIRTRKKHISPRSLAQGRYIKALAEHDIVFGIGPAGKAAPASPPDAAAPDA